MGIENGDILKAVLEFVLADGVIVQNVVHFIANFLTNQTEANVLLAADAYAEGLYSEIDQYVDSNVVTNPMTLHIVVWDGTEGEWVTERLVGSTIPSITFTGATDPMPNQCSPVLVANTGRPKSRGRKFLLPFLDSAADGSDWIGAVMTALGAALVAFLADEEVTVGNDLSPGVPRSTEDLFLPFSNGTVHSTVGTQRRRSPGLGI